MSIFYFHKQNSLAKQLSDAVNGKGFTFGGRGEMELKLQKLISDLGYDLWPTFHTVISNSGYSVEWYIELDPAHPIDAQALKIIKNKQPWSIVRLVNGPNMSTVVGYTSITANSPMTLGMAEMAQKGIIRSSYVPRAI